jgi:Uma2 family endonuclease
MVQTPVRQITLQEFLALPDTKSASEYIDGEVIQKPMPQGQHSILQIEHRSQRNNQCYFLHLECRMFVATAIP